MKKLMNKIALKIVNSNQQLQEEVVLEFAKGREIATYNVNNSEVTIENVILLNSMVTNSVFKNSPL